MQISFPEISIESLLNRFFKILLDMKISRHFIIYILVVLYCFDRIDNTSALRFTGVGKIGGRGISGGGGGGGGAGRIGKMQSSKISGRMSTSRTTLTSSSRTSITSISRSGTTDKMFMSRISSQAVRGNYLASSSRPGFLLMGAFSPAIMGWSAYPTIPHGHSSGEKNESASGSETTTIVKAGTTTEAFTSDVSKTKVYGNYAASATHSVMFIYGAYNPALFAPFVYISGMTNSSNGNSNANSSASSNADVFVGDD